MIGRRSVIGIAVLCALALCAFSATSASAFETAFTCAPNTTTGAEQFSDAHCVNGATGNVGFKHVEIAEGSTTNITGTNAKTASGTTAAATAKLEGTLAGVETAIVCTTVANSGTVFLSNQKDAAGGMYVSGDGKVLFSGCTVTKPPSQGCVVTGGSITTNALTATTEGQAAKKVQFKPKSGTTFASIPISGCTTSALNNTFPVTGSLIASASGATLTTTHAEITTQNTLKFGGNKAGLEGALTISMEGGNPITLT